MASELASQGYVVLLPTHNDQSACVAELKNSKIPFKRIPFGTTEGELKRREQLESRTAEVEFVLQKLPHMNKAGPYAGRLDLDKVVLVGHSFGAATALLAASRNLPLVKAVVVHDLWCVPLVKPSPIVTAHTPLPPVLATWSEEWYTNEKDFSVARALLPSASTKVGFPETCHSNYSDVPMFSQLLSRKMNAIGASDFREAMDVINRVQVAFLKKVVQGQAQDFQAILDAKTGIVLFEDDSSSSKNVAKA